MELRPKGYSFPMQAAESPEHKWATETLRLNAICPYYTMFPLDFPMREIAASPDARSVLDPFCGRGTSLYAARLSGLTAVGVDINPVATAIASAKLSRARPEAVVRLATRILREYDSPADLPEGEFWSWCFESTTLREIVTIRNALIGMTSPTAVMLRAVMLGILHGPQNKFEPSYLSNQMPRTYASKPKYAVRFWRDRGLRPVRISTVDVVSRRAAYLLGSVPQARGGRVYLGDATRILSEIRTKFDLVITSPPYYGMRTYVPDQWLRSWFLGGPPEVPYSTNGQIARQPSQSAFASALAEVWSAAANRCRPGARMAIRFGAIPSSRTDPEELLRSSIDGADTGWSISKVRPAGTSPAQARQAQQFGKAGSAIAEIDMVAELTSRPSAARHYNYNQIAAFP